jgi:ribosomal protein S18 acetylase RimI-like enzyme
MLFSNRTGINQSTCGPWASLYIGQRSSTLCVEIKNIDDLKFDLASIYAESFNGPPWFETWSTQDAIAALLEYTKQNARFIVSLDSDGAPVGLGIGVATNEGEGKQPQWYIAELCTKESARTRGICSDILQGLIPIGARYGCEVATSRTRENNTAMISIFTKSGFKEVGRVKATTGGAASERILFSRPITGGIDQR